nr:MAG TPA: hypothetical protein [Caudoviricetes sp.]
MKSQWLKSYLVFSIVSSGTITSFLPNGVSNFTSVSVLGLDLPF